MYEQYTDKQIVEMLTPRLEKLGWGSVINNDLYPSTIKMISTIYRSAYIRGQLGRSFIIGEKKNKEPVNTFKVGDKVKFLGFGEEALNNSWFYPPVNTIGEVVDGDLIYSLVQWPKGITAGDGIWRCRNDYLKKVTEHWVPATKDNIKVGSKVKMIDGEGYRDKPQWFPDVGTVGTIINTVDVIVLIQWPSGFTSENDRWFCPLCYLEVLLCE